MPWGRPWDSMRGVQHHHPHPLLVAHAVLRWKPLISARKGRPGPYRLPPPKVSPCPRLQWANVPGGWDHSHGRATTQPFTPPSPSEVSSVLLLLFTLMESGLKHRAVGTQAQMEWEGEVKGLRLRGYDQEAGEAQGGQGGLSLSGGVWRGHKGRLLFPPSSPLNNLRSSAIREMLSMTIRGSLAQYPGPGETLPSPTLDDVVCGLIPLLPTCQRCHRVGTRAQRAPGPAGVGWGGDSGPGPSLQPGLTLGVLAAVRILAGILQRLLQRRLRLLVLAPQLGAEGQLQQDQVVHHDAAIPEGSMALESAPARGTWVLGGALQKQPKVHQKRERGQRS
uniref:Uncharacterized protein n=1 Tax=Macaca fascicularis TaxID=9541 RepID=A0A7N9ICA3_MACFA